MRWATGMEKPTQPRKWCGWRSSCSRMAASYGGCPLPSMTSYGQSNNHRMALSVAVLVSICVPVQFCSNGRDRRQKGAKTPERRLLRFIR